MHGGVVAYCGAAADARKYLERDRSSADDYYLAEGTGLALRYVATPEAVHQAGMMDGDTYERWVAGLQIAGPKAGRPKGRLRNDKAANRFMEFTVNGPKTWSLAAALEPEIAEAYDAAQERAAQETISWLARHSTTRVGPRGRQVQMPVAEIEAAVIRHYTSRAGDPHRHLHVQINTRVLAKVMGSTGWRGLHTIGMRDAIAAINGIGHASMMCDPKFRATLAAHGFHVDLDTGELTELTQYVSAFSARSRQIEQNMDRYEASWRRDHPGQEPGPRLRQAWDRRAWADERPDKIVPTSGADLECAWRDHLAGLGFRPPTLPATLEVTQIGRLRRIELTAEALTRLGARRSAWNIADARGEVEQLIAATGVITQAAVRHELTEDLTARVVAASRTLLDRDDVPEHVRSLTSPHVLAVEHHLASRLAKRAESGSPPDTRTVSAIQRDSSRRARLTREQVLAAAHLASTEALVVVEGAAGTGKTATLAATLVALAATGCRMLVVSPTLKAAKVAAGQVGARSYSAAWLLHQYGFRWDDHGHWAHEAAALRPEARLRRGDLLVVDEAGMLDQDTAAALIHVADETGARLALIGDRHQLPAVGRGGVLDLASRYAANQCIDLDGVRRFTDPDYAHLSLQMRTGERPGATFDQLLARGEIIIHPSDVERLTALAALATDMDPSGQNGECVVIADTREAAARINTLVHHIRRLAGQVTEEITTNAGERVGIGDKIATRRNNPDADVANRDTWTVTGRDKHGIVIHGDAGRRRLPMAYVHHGVELAYATTTYGTQGTTVHDAHVLVGGHTSAASAYVAMTRGRDHNTAHLVADSAEEARQQWIDIFGRDRADLGPTHAARRALEDIDRYGPRPAARRPLRPGAQADPLATSRPAPSTTPGVGL